MKESPQFIKTTLLDIKRATSLVTQNVDKIVQELEQKNKVQQDNGQRNEVKQSVPEGKVFYSSVAYLQSTDDTLRLDALREKGDYEELLRLARSIMTAMESTSNIPLSILARTRVMIC